VTDTHKVMTMLILVVLVLVLLELPQSSALKSIIVIFVNFIDTNILQIQVLLRSLRYIRLLLNLELFSFSFQLLDQF
jgi:hypothetical protein